MPKDVDHFKRERKLAISKSLQVCSVLKCLTGSRGSCICESHTFVSHTPNFGGMYLLFRVRTGPGKSGKSWNFIMGFSRTGKSWKKATGSGKFWKSMWLNVILRLS